MTRVNRFIMSSDFPGLKNDAKGTITVTVPGGVLLSGNPASDSVWQSSSDLVIGKKNAQVRSVARSTKEGSNRYVGSNMVVARTGTVGGSPAFYSINVYLWRPSATVLRLTALIVNPYSSILVGASGAEVFTFDVSTFLSPFEQ